MDTRIIVHAIPEIAAQLLGFFIVFFILKKYAFGIVRKTIDDRRKQISDSFAEVDSKQKEIDQLKIEYESKINNIESEARVKYKEAIDEARGVAVEIKQTARIEAQKLTERAKANISQEAASAKTALKNDVAVFSIKIAERIIHKNLNNDENRELIRNILKEVEASDN